ncbi:M28 family peptidase [Nocardia salmonicida]|uniref:M28 family peptidase n=1 Tax=Nocardia salmonicida TaxID=53431 RepID=UPI0036721D3F
MWIAKQLREIGADSVAVHRFRSQASWVPAHLSHIALGLVANLLPGRIARLASAGVAVSYELDVSGRNHWLRRLLPAGNGVSVSARIDALTSPRHTLVLVAHHDAAHNGVLWQPPATAISRMLGRHTGSNLPSHALSLVALISSVLPFRATRYATRAVLVVAALLMIQSVRSYTTPGAGDNASGVAVILELARRLQKNPLPYTEVLLVFPGGEEAGNTGMRAWLRGALPQLAPETTLVVNLDAVGSGGRLAVAKREGLTGFFAGRDVALACRAAADEAIELMPVAIPNCTDAVIAELAGLRTISLLSYEDGWISNLHLDSDTVENMDWNTTQDAVALTERLADRWNAAVGSDA